MEFNPLLVKEFSKSLSLRKTKTDKVDAMTIAQKLYLFHINQIQNYFIINIQ